MGKVSTVAVQFNGKGSVVNINESDFDPKVHSKYKESSKKEEKKDPEPKEEPKGDFVKKESKPGWYNVFDKEGNQVNEKSLREKEADKLIETLG